MTLSVEISIDPNCLILGEIEKIDNSYNDAIGLVRCFQYEISKFQLIIWIDGIDYDLTKGLEIKEREVFEEMLLSKARKEFSDFSDEYP